MAGYEKYKDQNQVTWNIITAGNGYTMIATVLDDADPKYDPPATDQQASLPLNPSALEIQNKTIIAPDPPTGEQTRNIMIDLVTKIETFAAARRNQVLLKVTAKPGAGWGTAALVLLGLYLLSESERKRRR